MSEQHRASPFADQSVTDQLDSWAAALEMAVSTLTQTLEQVRECGRPPLQSDPDPGGPDKQEKGGSDVRNE